MSGWWSSKPAVATITDNTDTEKEKEVEEQQEEPMDETPDIIEEEDAPSWWRPTSRALLRDAEQAMLKPVKTELKQRFVKAEGNNINTIICGSGPPLVMLHGFGAGVGYWVCNLDYLARHHTIYAIDTIGFARSARPNFVGRTPEEAEDFFIRHLESWRKAVGLESFTLLGHSFGAYLSGVYSLKYPQYIQHLILADPWGIPKRDPDQQRPMPWKWRLALTAVNWFSPLAFLRGAGPYGPQLIAKFRPDLSKKFLHLGYDAEESEALADAAESLAEGEAEYERDQQQSETTNTTTSTTTTPKHETTTEEKLPLVARYVYHSNAQVPATGEINFHQLCETLAWAANPLRFRLQDLKPEIRVTFLYGEKSWMDHKAGHELLKEMDNKDKTYLIIPRAGHHIYVDNYKAFNRAVIARTVGADALPDRDTDDIMDMEDYQVVPLDIDLVVNRE